MVSIESHPVVRRPPLKKLGRLVHSQRSYPRMPSPMPCSLQPPFVRIEKMIALCRKPGDWRKLLKLEEFLSGFLRL